MPWFPDFASAVELARQQTRAAGLADPVGEYFAALNKGDTHALETVWPGEVVIYDPRAGEVRCLRWGSHDLPPQAGLGVYERGPGGLLAAARAYDDVEPPIERPYTPSGPVTT
jgi:hypothetical protein